MRQSSNLWSRALQTLAGKRRKAKSQRRRHLRRHNLEMLERRELMATVNVSADGNKTEIYEGNVLDVATFTFTRSGSLTDPLVVRIGHDGGGVEEVTGKPIGEITIPANAPSASLTVRAPKEQSEDHINNIFAMKVEVPYTFDPYDIGPNWRAPIAIIEPTFTDNEMPLQACGCTVAPDGTLNTFLDSLVANSADEEYAV